MCMAERTDEKTETGITKTGVRKAIWFHRDEAEALRKLAFEERRKESEIVREAVRRYLDLED